MMSWFRTYRPTQIGQLHLQQVRSQLQGMMKLGTLPSVWLLTGPKGTGKTSTSRILAALVNDSHNREIVRYRFFGEPKPKQLTLQEPDPAESVVASIFQGNSPAVLELDAASHRGIDDMRTLKEQLYVPPLEGEVKVYILDEVHMLTNEAFNSLLKVLEEPPPHAMFILATTEFHKLPATVVSRATVVNFTQAQPTEIQAALEHILTTEKIPFEPEAVTTLALQAQGSFRDAVKLAEQVAGTTGSITPETVASIVVPDLSTQIGDFCTAIITKQPETLVKIIQQLRTTQIPSLVFGQQLLAFLHHQLLQDLSLEPGQPAWGHKITHFLLQEFQTVPVSKTEIMPLLGFELKSLELIFRAQDKQPASGSTPTQGNKSPVRQLATAPVGATGSNAAQASQIQSVESLAIGPDDVVSSTTPTTKPDESLLLATPSLESLVNTDQEWPKAASFVSDNLALPDVGDSSLLLDKWQEFIEGVKQRNSTIAAILGSSQPIIGDRGQALVQVYYKFHQEQLQQPKFFRLLQEAIEQVVGTSVALEFKLATAPTESNPMDTVATHSLTEAALEALT